MNRRQLREEIAALEHQQWVEWSRHLADSETLSPERLARWKRSWAPYAQLTEAVKDQDRIYADRVLALLDRLLALRPTLLTAETEGDG